MRYDLTPETAVVATAKLRIYAALSAAGSVPTTAYSVASTTWGETTITWNNKPARGAARGTATVNSTTYAWYEIDVSAYVRSELAAGRKLVSFAYHDAANAGVAIRANSREGVNKPQLVITPDVAPTVSLTAPVNGAVYIAPGTIAITATAADSDGTVSKVDFYNGTTLLGSDTTAPYSFNWASVPAGTYTLTAKATDNLNVVTTSTPVTVIVDVPPTVSLTAPANGAVYVAPATITLTANAADTDGTITQVDFYNGTTKIGTATAAPYTFTWTNVAAGTYSLTAKATDNANVATTSTAVSVTVNANKAPTVSLTAPANNAVYIAPAAITLTANAADSDGTITQVDFYNGGTKIGTATAAPYTFVWANVAAGSYSLTARATDNGGAVTTSAAIAITVDAPPGVSLTAPANNAVYIAPAAITITANATDTDGTITQVDFYNGATKIGTATAAPYAYTWTSVPAGSYTLTAVATDNLGLATTSTAISVTVDTPPSISLTAPANNAVYIAPAAITLTANAADSDGTITQVDFYNGGTLIGSATAAPYTFAWTNVVAGSYSLTAVATDNNNVTTTSAAVAITVNNNTPPSVSLTAPINNAVYAAPAAITLTANATDSDGTVTQVDFYNGGTLLGSATVAPYSFAWSNVPSGTYSVTAIATDDRNASTTSAAITITVNALPTVTLSTDAATYTSPASITLTANATDSDGSISQVDFYNGGTLIGSATAAPYTFIWTNVPAGTYTLTAQATDNLMGSVASAGVSVTVNDAVISAGVYYIFADHLNTPRAITDTSNKTIWRWDSDPFGVNLPDEDPDRDGTKMSYNLRFPGQYYDKETGLHYNYFRDYDPAKGGYIESDPIGLRGGINTYTYVGASPISRIDPFGLFDIAANDPGGRNGATYGGTITVTGNNGRQVSVPGSVEPNPTNANPGVSEGIYTGTYSPTGHQGRTNGVRVENGGPVPTLGPNAAQGNQNFATGINIHCGFSANRRGSAGCITIDPTRCQDVWNVLQPGETGTITISR
jgi:RHS repeat-associated protein